MNQNFNAKLYDNTIQKISYTRGITPMRAERPSLQLSAWTTQNHSGGMPLETKAGERGGTGVQSTGARHVSKGPALIKYFFRDIREEILEKVFAMLRPFFWKHTKNTIKFWISCVFARSRPFLFFSLEN